MKFLLLSTSFTSNSLAKCYYRSILIRGHTALFLTDANYNSFNKRLIRKARRKIFNSIHPDFRSNDIVEITKQYKPDHTIVFQCELFSEQLLDGLRKHTLRSLVNIWPDNPYADWKDLADNLHSTLSRYDIVFSGSNRHIPILYQLGASKVEYLPFGYDPAIHYPVKRVGNDFSNLSYFGTFGTIPYSILMKIDRDFSIKIFGNGWDALDSWSRLGKSWYPKRGLGDEMRREVANSDYVINMVRQNHATGLSMKTFELPACGAFVITNYTEEQSDFFKDGVDCSYYQNAEEINELIKFYSRRVSLVNKIKENSLKSVRPHTYLNRFDTLIEFLREI